MRSPEDAPERVAARLARRHAFFLLVYVSSGALALLRDGACFRTCAERGLTSRAIGAVARDATEERLVGRHVRVQID